MSMRSFLLRPDAWVFQDWLPGMPLDFFPFSTVFICGAVILMIGTGIFWRNN
jgi:hypothetical protein